MKLRRKLALTIVAIALMSTVVFAKTFTLWKATDTTYVMYEHKDGLLGFYYYGTCSVRGADRGINADNRVIWYAWDSITFDVQGDYYYQTAWAEHKNSTKQVIETIKVPDKLNNEEKTHAYYNYRDEIVDDVNGHSVHDVEIKGGSLDEGEIKVSENRVLDQGKDKLKIIR